jgi:hypothetical protein
MRTPRNVKDGTCRSGDGCPRPQREGSHFCPQHASELARIRASLKAGDASNAERMKWDELH